MTTTAGKDATCPACKDTRMMDGGGGSRIPCDLCAGAGASVTLSAAMLKEALELIAPDGTPDQMTAEVAIEWSDNGHSGPGYYCWDVEYPDEGAILLGGAR
jgi:hypothetical protein